MTLNIGIVGASIAGMACAIELQRLGLTVTVFEKSSGKARQNGAGMMLPLDLMRSLLERNLIAADFEGILINEFSTFVAIPQQGLHFLTTTPLQGMCIRWKTLYETLQKNIDRPRCHYNCNVTQIIDQKDQVELTINNHNRIKVDYLICADGYESIGRKTIFPKVHPEFSHYIAWRGVIQLDGGTLTELHGRPYNNEYYRYLYENGHLLIYPIPASAEDKYGGEKHLLNWVLYEKITPSHPLFKNNPALAKQNFAPGTLPKSHCAYLTELTGYYFSGFPCSLIKKTVDPFVQPIFDVFVPHYVKGRICLVGDASILLRPHVGSNATKALKDAIALSNTVARELKSSTAPDISLAFKRWEGDQQKFAKQLFPLSRALGNLLVTHVPDLTTLTKEHMDELWKQTVSKYEWYGNSKL